VFADGVQPGSCNNEYDGPITNATIIAENKAYYPLNNSVSFQLPYYKSYYLTFTVKTPGINDQGNSLPGNVWIDQDYQGFTNSGCYGPAYPNQNFTVNETISHATSTSVFWATEVSGFSYTVNWLYPPSAPQNLQASAGNSQVTLSWTVVNGGRSPITNYNIYRSTSSGTETLHSTTGNVTSYTDTGLVNGQTYFYKITAVSSVGESSQSNEASATPMASAEHVVATIPVSIHPFDVGVNDYTNMIYGTTRGTIDVHVYTVYVINGTTNSVVKTLQYNNEIPSGVGVNPITNKIYVGTGPSTISLIDGTTNSVIDTISLGNGSGPSGVVVNSNTNKIYVADQGSNTVSVIDGTTNSVVSTVSVGSAPFGIDVNPITNKIYVVDGSGLQVIDGTTNSVVSTISVGSGSGPNGVVVNSNTNKIYVTNQNSNTISVIDGTTNSIVDTISLGNGNAPDGIGVNINTNKIYVTGGTYGHNTVFVINGATNTVVQNLTVGYSPLGVAVNPNTDKIYVANYWSNSVSVIGDDPIKTMTTTTITISSNKTIPDNPFTLTATVLPSSATGTIQFQVDGTNLETPVTLSGGTARMTTSLPTGTHDITASYSGDSNFAPSISGQYTITVQTPALATQDLIVIVNNMTLTHGITKSLDAKLDATISYLNTNDTYHAKSALQSFVNEVNAQTGKHITQEQANQLVVTARNIIKAIP